MVCNRGFSHWLQAEERFCSPSSGDAWGRLPELTRLTSLHGARLVTGLHESILNVFTTIWAACLRFLGVTLLNYWLYPPRVHSIFKRSTMNVNDALIILLYSFRAHLFKTEVILLLLGKCASLKPITCYFNTPVRQQALSSCCWPLLSFCTVSLLCCGISYVLGLVKGVSFWVENCKAWDNK